jgi:hypothetical protein
MKHRSSFDDPGCSLQSPADWKRNRHYLFVSNAYDDSALINIDGKDVRLKLVSYHEPKGPSKKGSRSIWKYAGAGTTVQIDLILTHPCNPNDECNIEYFDATLTVTGQGRKTVVQAKGLCGD